MPLQWDPRQDSAAYWAWFIAGSAFLEWATEIFLLRRQLHVVQSAPVPPLLQSVVTPEQYKTSAERFEATYRTRTVCATTRMIFVFMVLYFDALAVTWEWSQMLANQDTPGIRRIVVWLSILALGCVPMRIPLYLSEQKLSQRRRTPSPKGFLSYIFDFPTVLAAFCLGSARILPGTFLPDINVSASFIGGITSFVLSNFNESYRKNLDSKWMLKSNLLRVHAAGALDVEKSSFPITTPFPLPFDTDDGTIPKIAKLTSEEEETVIKQRTFRPKKSITFAEIALLLLICIVALLIFLHILATSAILDLLFFHPVLVSVYFLGKYCEQKADLSGDS